MIVEHGVVFKGIQLHFFKLEIHNKPVQEARKTSSR